MVWLIALASVFIVSFISFIGALTLLLSREHLNRILPLLVSFAAGSLLGGAFFHLIPESATDGLTLSVSFSIL